VNDLCFYNPREVYEALLNNAEIKKWLEFISLEYEPPKKRILLFYPCSAEKPYYESRLYRQLYKTLSRLGSLRRHVHVITVSEPFGLVPEEFYGRKTEWHDWQSRWYDCPGLFEWWCRRNSQPYQVEYVEKCIRILAEYVARFLTRITQNGFNPRLVGFVRTYSSSLRVRRDHTHRRILELASRISGVKIELLPPKEVVAEIVAKRGRVAWDFYGVAHPLAQEYLLKYLRRILNEA